MSHHVAIKLYVSHPQSLFHIFEFTMARTKDVWGKKKINAKRGNELAAVAQCMDNHLREENEQLERQNKRLRVGMKLLVDKIERREQRIRDLEANWEDLAQTLSDALEDLERYRTTNQTLMEHVLDCTCTETEFNLVSN